MKPSPSDIDITIGKKIKAIRNQWGISQSELAEKISVSFQQVQKYEKGVTSLSIKRLSQIGEALNVPLSYFILNDTTSNVSSPGSPYGNSVDPEKQFMLLSEDEKKMVRLFRKISNKNVRHGLLKQLQGVLEIETGKGTSKCGPPKGKADS